MDKLGDYSSEAIELLMIYATKVFLAIITLIVGLWIIKTAVKVTRKALKKTNTDETLVLFLLASFHGFLKRYC